MGKPLTFFYSVGGGGAEVDQIKAVNREVILSRRYRDRDLAKFESSRRYQER